MPLISYDDNGNIITRWVSPLGPSYQADAAKQVAASQTAESAAEVDIAGNVTGTAPVHPKTARVTNYGI